MPLYLCQVGAGLADPWRHGIQVYSRPYNMMDSKNDPPPPSDDDDHSTLVRRIRHAEVLLVDDICLAHGRYWLRLRWPGNRGGFAGYVAVSTLTQNNNNNNQKVATTSTTGDRPEEEEKQLQEQQPPDEEDEEEEEEDEEEHEADMSSLVNHTLTSDGQGGVVVTCVRTGLPFQSSAAMKLLPLYDDGLSEQLPPIATIAAASQDENKREPVFCRICREGLHEDADDEQPSPAAEQEDEGGAVTSTSTRRSTRRTVSAGSNASSALEDQNSNDNGEDDDNVVMDDEDDDEDDDDSLVNQNAPSDHNTTTTLPKQDTGPVVPSPPYAPNPHALENPLLAPCACTGSMAFVHYLCVEQWRCRSRHPAAQNGLACETCGSLYTLPPPASRPNAQEVAAPDQDWLDAMPPHVIQALRQPHLLWQLGAAVVRRRWLRPLAPVLLSPLVALYCRARRLLKKRGVARRRWACSLCRRRARWKCVRCLRSYYCSRQCQNVSWHIVHKHVCYKPIRLWWSVVVYGSALLWAVPGILRDPLMYDLGLLILPCSFLVIGILAGGIATALKKSAIGWDLRGRLLELTVLLGTIWLTAISWGLVQGFFGQSSACLGGLGRRQMIVTNLNEDDPTLYAATLSRDDNDMVTTSGTIALFCLRWLRSSLLVPAQTYYLFWDRFFATLSQPWVRSLICVNQPWNILNETAALTLTPAETDAMAAKGCFEFLPHTNADFFIANVDADDTEDTLLGPSKCAADLLLVSWLYLTAAVAYVGSALYKYQERRQRRLAQNQRRHHHAQQLRQAHAAAAAAAQVPRPHQD